MSGVQTYHILEVAIERLHERMDELEDGELILWCQNDESFSHNTARLYL